MKNDTMTATGRKSKISKLNREIVNHITEHAADMIPIVSNCDGGSCAGVLDKAVVLPSGHEDGLHHEDVEDGEQDDGQDSSWTGYP